MSTLILNNHAAIFKWFYDSSVILFCLCYNFFASCLHYNFFHGNQNSITSTKI